MITQIIFYFFALLLVCSAALTIVSRQAVHSCLYLMLTFFATSVVWMIWQSEFLALALVFMYVGAVMTLFLFVVMMWPTPKKQTPRHTHKYTLLFTGLIFIVLLFYCIHPKPILCIPETRTDTSALGQLLYTQHIVDLELLGLVLLVAMVGSIGLVWKGKKPGTKKQNVTEQMNVQSRDRVRLIHLKETQP